MYESGEYTEFDKTFAGTYSKVTGARVMEEVTPYGGVAIPVMVVSHSSDVLEWPREAIEITRENKVAMMDRYTFANHNLVEAMVDETLLNAQSVYLCPNDGSAFFSGTKGLTKRTSFGKGYKFSVEMWFDGNDYRECINGVKVVLSHTGNEDAGNYTFQLYSPDGVYIHAIEGGMELSIAEMKSDEGVTIQLEEENLHDGASAGALYATNPKVAYKDVNITVYLHEYLGIGEKDTVVMLGGTGTVYSELETAMNEVYSSGNRVGYVACDMVSETLAKSTDAGAIFAFIKNTEGYAGLHAGYYIIIGSTVAHLIQWNATASVYPADEWRVKSVPVNVGDRVIDVLESFDEIIIHGNTDNVKCWGGNTDDDTIFPIIVAFTPAFPRLSLSDRMESFMYQAGNERAELLYYPYWSDDLATDATRDECKVAYQEVQNLYLNNRGRLCSYSQLLMDESLHKGSREWVTDDPLTLHSPHLISLASGKKGKRASQKIGAYTAGALVLSGGKSAKAFRYRGSDTLELYSQPEIKNMYAKGVMAYHLQSRVKMLYLDNSTYKYNSDTQKTYPVEFERNYVIRTVHTLQARVDDMFAMYYGDDDRLSLENEETVCQMLEHDILKIISGLRSYGRLMPPQSEDVRVTEISHTSYHAKVGLRLIYSPEILYLDIGI